LLTPWWVQVIDEEAGNKYYFACGKWFGLGIEDGLLERTLAASATDPRGSFTEYKASLIGFSCMGQLLSPSE
jgi:hypothetical protein